jgi:hypothetical protein
MTLLIVLLVLIVCFPLLPSVMFIFSMIIDGIMLGISKLFNIFYQVYKVFIKILAGIITVFIIVFSKIVWGFESIFKIILTIPLTFLSLINDKPEVK